METDIVVYLELPSKLQRDINRAKRAFVRRGSKYRSKPHLTLYLARFNKLNAEKLADKLKETNLKKFNFTITSVKRRRKFFYINVGRSKTIVDLHKKILKLATPLRSRKMRSNDVKRLREGKFSARELRLLRKYGATMVNDRFSSHITLGSASLDIPGSELKDLEKRVKKTLSCVKGKYPAGKIVLIFIKRPELGSNKIIFKRNILLN